MKKIFLIFLVLFFVKPALAQSEKNAPALRAVALLDYIAGDYHMSVSPQGGQIKSEAEYQEMQDFISLISHYLDETKIDHTDSLYQETFELKQMIDNKAPVADVRQASLRLKNGFLDRFSIATSPPSVPNLKLGKEIYLQTCANCHGANGKADTPTAKQLNPPPRVFADRKVLDTLSPFKAFNSITFGIQDTAMPSFQTLSEEDRWAVAAYLFELAPDLPPPSQKRAPIDWKAAMALNDEEIMGMLQKEGVPEQERLSVLSHIRHLIGYQPAETLAKEASSADESRKAGNAMLITITRVKEALETAQKGNFASALDLSVSAYLDGFEQAETLIRVTGRADLVSRVEKDFINLRQTFRENPPSSDRINAAGKRLLNSLEESRNYLKEMTSLSPSVAFIASFTIIFREGLEAILLLAIILSVVSAIEEERLKKWVHASWVAALAVGFLTWVLARGIITGIVREGMEGWISLWVAMVLIYVSFWIFAKRDVQMWKNFLIGKIRGAKKLGFLSVGFVAFLAVYRESFETILFFETLRLQATGQTGSLTAGVAFGFISLVVAGWLIFKVGKKIPLNLFFGVSGIVLLVLAVAFVGQGIHSLQESNYLPHTPVPFFSLPELGIFPTLESLSVQGILTGFFIIGLIWQQWIKTPREESRLDAQMRKASLELFSLHELEEHLKGHLNHLKSTVAKGRISEAEVKEMVGHMEDLDHGIHHMILQLQNLRAEIPRRFDELFQEFEILEDKTQYEKLLSRAEEFKNHLESLKKKGS